MSFDTRGGQAVLMKCSTTVLTSEPNNNSFSVEDVAEIRYQKQEDDVWFDCWTAVHGNEELMGLACSDFQKNAARGNFKLDLTGWAVLKDVIPDALGNFITSEEDNDFAAQQFAVSDTESTVTEDNVWESFGKPDKSEEDDFIAEQSAVNDEESTVMEDNVWESFGKPDKSEEEDFIAEQSAVNDEESIVMEDNVWESFGKPDKSEEDNVFMAILEALEKPVMSKEDYDFVAQKYTVGDTELRELIIAQVHKNFKKLYRQEFGSELLGEMAYIPETREQMACLLTDNVMRCAVDEFGGKFLIACIETNSECFLREIEKTMIKQAHRLSILKFGSEVVRKWISIRKPSKEYLMPILAHALEVLKFDCGIDVCLTILENGYLDESNCQQLPSKNLTAAVRGTSVPVTYSAIV